MKIYVAGKFEDRAQIRQIMDRLEARGHTITHDWTQEDPVGRTGVELSRFQRDCAHKDLEGVKAADLVLVINHEKLFGGAAEMGMAIALGKHVCVVGPQIRDNIFFHLSTTLLFPNLEAALALIL